jgi:putative peptidoglycan lipid II flippase
MNFNDKPSEPTTDATAGQPHNSRIGRHAFSTMASSSFGIVTSVLLDAIVVAVFGMGRPSDAYFIATTIPTIVITLFMLQATRIIQPVFVSKRQAEGEQAGVQYLNLVMGTGFVIVCALSLLGAVLSPMLMRLQANGATGEQLANATRLSIFLFAFLPLYFPIVVMRAALNSYGVFALPAAMKFFENTFKIIFVLLLGYRFGLQALVLGTFVGALWQLTVFYVALRRKGFRLRPLLGFANPDMIQAYRLVTFQMSSQLCGTGVEVVNNAIGSMSGAGNVTALRLATRIIESFAGLLPESVVTAAVPAVARSVAACDAEGTKKHLQQAMKLLFIATLPVSVWLVLMNRPLIALLYQRANFSPEDTALVATLLLFMIPYLVLNRILSLLELPFFAAQNTRTPFLGSAAYAAVHIGVSLLLVGRIGIYALPVGRAAAGIVGPLLLAVLLRKRIGKLGLATVRHAFARVLGASLIMGVFIFLAQRAAGAVPVQGLAARLVALGVPTAAGMIAMGIALIALRVVTLPNPDSSGASAWGWRAQLATLAKYPSKLW